MLDRISFMPNWPKRGSVELVDGVMVVKFQDYSPQTKETLEKMRVGR
jgi:hypothetical protein